MGATLFLTQSCAIELVPIAVEQSEPRLVLFRIARKRAVADEAREAGRPARLFVDRLAVRGQRGEELAKPGIAKALVVGTALWEIDRRARPGLHGDADPTVEAREQRGLEM
jgi:hypothetical protein